MDAVDQFEPEPVEREVHLPVMMFVELVGPVLDGREHLGRDRQGDAQGSAESGEQLRRQMRVVGAQVGKAADPKPDRVARPGERLEFGARFDGHRFLLRKTVSAKTAAGVTPGMF